MPVLSISCRLADALFPCDPCGSVFPVPPDAGLTLSLCFGLPLAEMDFEVVPFVPSPGAPIASNGEILVGFVWADGVKYEITTG